MENFLDKTTFQYYDADITKCKPIGKVSIREFIEAHRCPKPSIVELFTQISNASALGDLKLKASLKKQLYYFTPSINVKNWRSYENIESFNEIFQVDFDGISWAEELRDELFEKLSCVVCAYVSPSKFGCKLLIRVPLCSSVEEFKSYVYGLFSFLQKYAGLDIATRNIAIPLFLSMDENIKWRENPTVWSIKGVQKDEFNLDSIDPDFEATDELSKEDILGVATHIKNTIGLADKNQVGHLYVKNSALIAGGYTARYLNIDEYRMLDYLIKCIEESDYLQKGLKGYKKTANTMFNLGLKSPLEYKNNGKNKQ